MRANSAILREHRHHTEIYGWRLPSSLGWVGLVAIVGTLALLVSDPQPWRATRQAWFWLMTNPIGTIVFLVLTDSIPPLLPHATRHAGSPEPGQFWLA